MIKMKNILFCLQTIVRGGVEKELLELCKQIKDAAHIKVLVFYSSDCEMENEFRRIGVFVESLNVDQDYYFSRSKERIIKRIKKFRFFEAGIYFIKHILGIGVDDCNISLASLKEENADYDYAVCYHIHSPIVIKYVATCCTAKTKYAWIHNDFYTTRFPVAKVSKYLKGYDKIIGASGKVSEEFVSLCPALKAKSITIPNFLDASDIIQKSTQPTNISFKKRIGDELIVLTIGRLTEQKGIDLAVQICSLLVQKGYKIIWYIIGWGEEEHNIRKLIDIYHLNHSFVLLGQTANPYPLLRQCDIYAQPSRHEGFGLALAEAKILHKPIISTDFAGAEEQIVDMKTGIIVPANDVNAFAEGLILLFEKDLRQKFSRNLEMEGYNYTSVLAKDLFI